MPGAGNLIVEARAALLDAVKALDAHKDSVILIGAQAVYLRTGNATFALAETTNDSDFAIDPQKLAPDPRLEEAMTEAGFILNPVSQNTVAHEATAQALVHLAQLFASSDALGSTMAGRAEEGVGQPDTVSASVSFLANDLLSALA